MKTDNFIRICGARYGQIQERLADLIHIMEDLEHNFDCADEFDITRSTAYLLLKQEYELLDEFGEFLLQATDLD